jgi:hypothetical protein
VEGQFTSGCLTRGYSLCRRVGGVSRPSLGVVKCKVAPLL